jgi:hypothetical protein
MTTEQDPISERAGAAREAGEPSEEELRAAYDAQIKKLRVEHLIVENVVTLANLGMRRTGLAPGTEDERDAEQVRLAIESIRALVPLVEQIAPEQVAPIRDAVSQLQLAFVRIGGQSKSAQPGAAPTDAGPGEGGTAPPGAGSGGAAPPGGGSGTEPPPSAGSGTQQPPTTKRDEPGPAQRSGRLWVPGQ